MRGRWGWSESVWYLGNWWGKHFESDYWCLVTDSGELMYQDDADWFDSWGYDLPWPEQGPRTRTRSCCLKPNLATLHENEPGFVPSPGAASSTGPGGLPAQGSEAAANSSDSESSSNSSPAVDTRKTKSEPPKSPRELLEEERPEGLPANGTHEAAEEPRPPAPAGAGGNEVVETPAAAEAPAVEMVVNSCGLVGCLDKA